MEVLINYCINSFSETDEFISLVMGDTEYSVIDTSDTTFSGIVIDYWLGIV